MRAGLDGPRRDPQPLGGLGDRAAREVALTDDVAVHRAPGVCCRQRRCDVRACLDRGAPRQRAVGEPVGQGNAVEERHHHELFVAGYSRTISFLESLGKQVVFFIDVPELGFEPRLRVRQPARI